MYQLRLEMLHAAIVGSGLHERVQCRIGIFLVLKAIEAVCPFIGDVLAVWRMIEQIERLSVFVRL